MKRSKGKKRKNNKNWRLLLIGSTTVLLIGIVLLLNSLLSLLNIKPIYQIETRVENIEKYAKENEEYTVSGWLRVQGTNIDYPILYDKDYMKLENLAGEYTWVLNNKEDMYDRTLILGHNIRNVSSNPLIANKEHDRFEQLMSFLYYDFAKENQYIQYTKGDKDYLFKIFAVTMLEDTDLKYSSNMTKEVLKEYIDATIDQSYFKYDVEVDEEDKIITLITCTRFFSGSRTYKFKVDARLVGEDEKIELSKVTEKESYKEIKEIMKGGEVDEEYA